MSRVPLWLLACLTLLGAAAPARAARPAPPPAAAPEPPHDHTIFFSSGGSWLGISIADITGERVRELKLKEETGAEVRAVMPGSPAEEAGILAGDRILELDRTHVNSSEEFSRLARKLKDGESVIVRISREGRSLYLTLRLPQASK